MLYGLSEETIDNINKVFEQFESIEKVILYGSRALETYKNGSDIDLTIIGNLDHNILYQIQELLEELFLPYKIDLSIYEHIENQDLIEHINRVGKTFYQKSLQ